MFVDTENNRTIFTVTGLTPASMYTVFLSAFTGAGEGRNSSKVMDGTTFGNFICTQM